MAVTPIDPNAATGSQQQAQFDSTVDNAKETLSEEALTERLVEGAVIVAGQMIIMPRANEILSEGMSED
ncbi:hypothetical protein CAL18_15780 [Bordetella genomosp. 7]|uniref:hypothetical protein n=1 Tax=Bordetella genomosp. 7 TaxID=1416805 RepID=UPI000B9EB3A2|nr:hypothetical protein [Bordetella genomosp. 7]OZI17574.1 hypothetical protein CAL18_15780 [Bordetella genomosp. 7]